MGTYEKEERDGGEQKVVSVRGPNRNLLMGVASPQREKSCVVASSTDEMPLQLPPSMLLERGREGACYFGSLDGEDVKRIPGFRRGELPPLVGHYCWLWIECDSTGP